MTLRIEQGKGHKGRYDEEQNSCLETQEFLFLRSIVAIWRQ